MSIQTADLNVMVKAANKTSKVLIRDFGEVEKLQVSQKGPGDFVTASDKKAEKIIIEELQFARPDHGILSEEIGEIKGKNEFRWIIDPIDGTSNFLHGIPHFCISIALEKEKEIIAGLVFDPIKDELFCAEKKKGAFLNNQKIRVSSRSKLNESLFLTGGPKATSKIKEKILDEYMAISKKTNVPIRKSGSAALDMAFVASGRCEAYWQRDINYWDVAAGIILVKESGGFVNDLNGGNDYLSKKEILATNSNINNEFIELIK